MAAKKLRAAKANSSANYASKHEPSASASRKIEGPDESDEDVEDDQKLSDDVDDDPESSAATPLSSTFKKDVTSDGISLKEVPRSTIGIMFDHIIETGLSNQFEANPQIRDTKGARKQRGAEATPKYSLTDYLNHVNNRPLKVGTMCSGTESPILAMMLGSQTMKRLGLRFEFYHLFSAEIESWKQHYIQTNFCPPLIFRDITELQENLQELTTAFGSKAPIPGDLDLLIAGTSCVDFSGLNSNKKGLHARGESGDTFFATLEYMDKFRPRIVIFENISTAPWTTKINKGTEEKGMDFYIAEKDYTCHCIFLDTKNFYLPHTRRRGYMICIDMKNAYTALYPDTSVNDEGLRAFGASQGMKNMLTDWEVLVKALGRDASVPVDTMLLSADDAHVVAMREGERDEKSRKPIGWDKCRVGHKDYRSNHNLGTLHTLTSWADDYYDLPDHFKLGIRGLTQRVCDTIDIAHLRNVSRGFDDRFYSRILELSQNVFRDEDDRKNGIVGCLTPSGFPFSTLRGRRINGVEAMILQGMPTDQLDLANLTQDNLRNLAGNAMSSTVVGCTIFSALSVFYVVLPRGDARVEETKASFTSSFRGEDILIRSVQDPTTYEKLSTRDAQSLAASTCLLCACGAAGDEYDKVFQECTVCEHTTCTKCGGKPKHHYAALSEITRIDPMVFISTITKSIPRTFSFTRSDRNSIIESLDNVRQTYEGDISSLDPTTWNTWNDVWKRMGPALSSVLYLRETTRSKSWEIVFDSSHARAVLTVSKKGLQWLVYADVSDLERDNLSSIHLRKHPILKMTPTSDSPDITQGQWKLWLPKPSEVNATITSSGQLIPSYHHQIGLTSHTDEFVATEVEIFVDSPWTNEMEHDISGKYRLVPECGQAFNSYHIKIGIEDLQRPIYLFLDHAMATGNPKDHSFVFTENCERIESVDSPRNLIAKIDSSWRQPIFNLDTPNNDSGERKEQKLVHVSGAWIEIPDIQLNPAGGRKAVFRYLSPDTTDLEDSCNSLQAIFACEMDLEGAISHRWLRNEWVAIDKATSALFNNNFKWVLAQGIANPNFLSSNSAWKEISTQTDYKCSSCVPTPPGKLWSLNDKGHNCPFEKPDEAALYERALKSVPSSLSAMVYVKSVKSSEKFTFKIGMNVSTLIHRSMARLSGIGPIKTFWRLVTDDFRMFQSRLLQLEIQSSHEGSEAEQPPSFRIPLRPEQLRALKWMENQESNSLTPFIEEEITEEKLPSLGYRLWGKAIQEVRVKGGVLAFDVGFGKTPVTIGLIDRQRNHLGHMDWAKNNCKGFLATNATLIIVPHHLLTQWRDEFTKFIDTSRSFKVVVINTIGALEKTTIGTFKEADIIIVSVNILRADKYAERVSHYAGLVGVEDKATQIAKREWYVKAAERIQHNVEELKREPAGFKTHLDTLFEIDYLASQAEVLPTPSKRVSGERYVKTQQQHAGKKRPHAKISGDTDGKVTTEDSVPTEPKKIQKDKVLTNSRTAQKDEVRTEGELEKLEGLESPILEMFAFKRIVIDEFTYISSVEILGEMVKYFGSQADSKWLLSGTPALGGFADVKFMASLLNINLGEDEYFSKEDISKKRFDELTNAEQFIALRQNFSPALKEQRHFQAQKFLDQFARKDVADIGDIQISEHIRLVRLPPTEYAMYLELTHRMVALMFDIKYKKHTGSDSLLRMRQVVLDCLDGREAMLIRASTFQVEEIGSGGQSAQLKEAKEIAREILDARKECLTLLKANIHDELKRAHWLQKNKTAECGNFTKWGQRVEKGEEYGDSDTSISLGSLIRETRESSKDEDWKDFYRDPLDNQDTRLLPPKPDGMCEEGVYGHLHKSVSDLRNSTTRLSTMGGEYMTQMRSLRFFQAICDIQNATLPCVNLVCSGCKLEGLTPEEVTILSKCGHLVCNLNCLAAVRKYDGDCTVKGCQAVSRSIQFLPAEDVTLAGPAAKSLHGKKLDEIVQLIQDIPADEKVLVFVQFDHLVKKIEEALDTSQVPFLTLKGATQTALTRFQTSASNAKVLILNIGDASASGSNLTVANHIIFVSPYLTKGSSGQAKYDAAMTQAIGRARRFGQIKRVHVYHFISSKTIDVDILEKRSGKNLQRCEHLLDDVEPPYDGFESSRVALVPRDPTKRGQGGEFASTAASEIFSPGSEYT